MRASVQAGVSVCNRYATTEMGGKVRVRVYIGNVSVFIEADLIHWLVQEVAIELGPSTWH